MPSGQRTSGGTWPGSANGKTKIGSKVLGVFSSPGNVRRSIILIFDGALTSCPHLQEALRLLEVLGMDVEKALAAEGLASAAAEAGYGPWGLPED